MSHLSIKGLKEHDYGRQAMPPLVSMEASNPRNPSDVLKEAMNASDKVRIQYANKYAGSSNYWKNSIGMNKAIIDNNVLGTKAEQEAKFAKFAKEKKIIPTT